MIKNQIEVSKPVPFITILTRVEALHAIDGLIGDICCGKIRDLAISIKPTSSPHSVQFSATYRDGPNRISILVQTRKKLEDCYNSADENARACGYIYLNDHKVPNTK